MNAAPSSGVGVGLEASSQDQLHNLQGPMQNENVRLLVQKEGKSVIKVLEYGAFPFSHSLSLNLSWCFKFAVY